MEQEQDYYTEVMLMREDCRKRVARENRKITIDNIINDTDKPLITLDIPKHLINSYYGKHSK